jgi:hypothetical protein
MKYLAVLDPSFEVMHGYPSFPTGIPPGFAKVSDKLSPTMENVGVSLYPFGLSLTDKRQKLPRQGQYLWFTVFRFIVP